MIRISSLLPAALLLAVTAAAADNALEDLRGLRTRLSKVPLYNGRHLQLMVFSPESEQRGGLLVAKDPVMDIIRRSADINTITTGPDTKIYPLGTELPELFRFWSQRLFSDGVAGSDHADIDQSTGHIVGDGPVHFRAPMLDLDGVGFDGDYLNRTLMVKQQVVALLRAEASNPLRYLNSKEPIPELSNAIRVTGDTLFIDFDKGEITLTGTIRIADKKMTGSCDRMLIRLAQDGGGDDDDDDDAASIFSVEGVREIVLIGHVRMEAVPEGPDAERRFATAEKVVLRPGDGTIRMTGDDTVLPVLRQGENSLTGQEIRYSRQTEKLEVLRQARMVYLREEKEGGRKRSQVTADRILYNNAAGSGELVGHVTVDDSDMHLQCGRGRFRLNRNAAAESGSGGEAGGAESLAGLPRFSGGGELEQVVCNDKVRMSRKEGDRIAETATAEQATLDWRNRVLTLKGGAPTISRGADTLSAGRLTMYIEQEKLLAEPASKVVLCAGDSASSPNTVITSDRSDFDYGGNLLIFEGHVQVRDPRLDVDCNRMEITLKPDPKADSSGKSAGFGSGGGKVLDRIVCIGNVHAREPRMDLTGDKVTLTFAEAKDPENAPTAFKSGNIALDRIDCEGNVRLEHLPDPAAAPAAGEETALWQGGSLHRAVINSDTATMTLPDNRAVFDGNVRVREPSTTLDCRKLELFGRASKAALPPSEAETLDADPFAKIDVSRAPKAVAIGDNRELERVIASGDVDFTRKVENGTQRVTGDRAVYEVDKRELTITGDRDKRPRFYDTDASRNGVADRIVVDLATEKVHLKRSTIEFDPGKFN